MGRGLDTVPSLAPDTLRLPNPMQHLRLVAPFAALASVVGADVAPGESQPMDTPVRATLLLDRPLTAPGDTATLGISFDIADGWNLYWINPGESGAAPKVTLTLPPGVTASDLRWPSPERKVLPGDILDYIYTRRVTLLTTLTAGKDFAPAPAGAVTADLWWLMCDKEKCVPGEARAERTLAVADSPAGVEWIADAGARLPMPPEQGELVARWESGTLVLHVPGAASLVFMPLPENEVNPDAPKAILREGMVDGDTLRLTYDPGVLKPGTRVTGNLEISRASGEKRFLAVVSPAPTM